VFKGSVDLSVKVKKELAILRPKKHKFCEWFAWDLLANPVLNIKTAQYTAEEVTEVVFGLPRRYASNEDLHQTYMKQGVKSTLISLQ
jgi:hypothetical protein